MGKNCLEKVMSKCRIKGAPFFNELMMFKGQSLKMVCFGEKRSKCTHTREKGRRQCSVVDCRHCSQCRQCRHLAVVVEVMFLEGNAQSI